MPSLRPRLTITNSRSPYSSRRSLVAVAVGEFRGLLGDLVDDPLEVRPVVAEARGAALHLVGIGQLRRGPAKPGEGPGIRDRGPRGAAAAARSAALICSQFRQDLVGRVRLNVAEDVRGAADDLGGDGGLHVEEVEDAASAAYWACSTIWSSRSPSSSASSAWSRPRARRTPRTTPPAGTEAAVVLLAVQGQPPGCRSRSASQARLKAPAGLAAGASAGSRCASAASESWRTSPTVESASAPSTGWDAG